MRAAVVARLGATGLFLMAAASCTRDQLTAPPLRLPASLPQRATYTTVGTYSIPVPPTSYPGDGSAPLTNTGIIIPAGTYYRIRVHGSVTVTSDPTYLATFPNGERGQVGTWGPGGIGYYNLLVVQLKWRNTTTGAVNPISLLNLQGGTGAPDSAQTDVQYASTQVEIQAGRSGLSCSTGQGGTVLPCYDMTASQTVTVESVTSLVHLVANPVAVHPNQQVTFTASRDDGGTLYIDHWWWQPDPGQAGNATQPCWSLNPCQMNVAGSGTMYVYTNVGSTSAHVTVYQATNPDTSFRLVADRSTAVIGDTVTFTPLYNGVPGPAAQWRWAPSDTSNDATACANGVSPCKKAMVASGTMWVYTSTTAGQGDSASTNVNVVCATNDTLLNLPELREGLAALDQMSRGGSTEPGNRHEMGGYLFWNPTTNQYQYILSFRNDATACSWRDQPWPSAGDGWWQIARSHSHPYRPKLDTLPAGTMCGLHRLQVPAIPQPGPSPPDDSIATDGFPSFVVDADSVYRTDGPGTHRSWPRNGGSCQLLPPAVLDRTPGDRWFLPNSETRKATPRLTQRRIR